MSKQKKKRNKPYRGEDAAPSGPVVHRYTAVQRSPLAEWWLERKRTVKIVGIAGGGTILVGWLLVETVRVIF